MKKNIIILFAIIIYTTPKANAIEEIKYEPAEEKNLLLKARAFQEKGLEKTFETGIVKQVKLALGYQGLFNFNTLSNSSSKLTTGVI